jgi:hypothetical protein
MHYWSNIVFNISYYYYFQEKGTSRASTQHKDGLDWHLTSRIQQWPDGSVDMGQTLLVEDTEFKPGPHKQPKTTSPGRASPNPIALQIVYPAQGIFFLCHSRLRANASVSTIGVSSMTKGFPGGPWWCSGRGTYLTTCFLNLNRQLTVLLII